MMCWCTATCHHIIIESSSNGTEDHQHQHQHHRYSSQPRVVDLQRLRGVTICTTPSPLFDFDFMSCIEHDSTQQPQHKGLQTQHQDQQWTTTCQEVLEKRVHLHATSPCTVHAVLVWWDIHLTQHHTLTSAPLLHRNDDDDDDEEEDDNNTSNIVNTATNTTHRPRAQSWRQLLYCLPTAVSLPAAGAEVTVCCTLDDRHGLRVHVDDDDGCVHHDDDVLDTHQDATSIPTSINGTSNTSTQRSTALLVPIKKPLWLQPDSMFDQAVNPHAQRARYCTLLVLCMGHLDCCLGVGGGVGCGFMCITTNLHTQSTYFHLHNTHEHNQPNNRRMGSC